MSNTVYLGLGTNLGDRQNNLSVALNALAKQQVHTIKTSSIIETEPVGGPPQNQFLNMVVKAQTNLLPQELLKALKKVEEGMGRTPTVRNGPRIIDIDILLYNNDNIKIADLTIPHPRMLQRSFVMDPLKEIAPDVFENLTHENF